MNYILSFLWILSFSLHAIGTNQSVNQPSKKASVVKGLKQIEHSSKKTSLKKNRHLIAQKTKPNGTKKLTAKVKKKNFKGTRKLSSDNGIICEEFFNSKYEESFIGFASSCPPDKKLCLTFREISRNECKEGQLSRQRCDLLSEEGYSIELILCGEKGCSDDGLKCNR